MDRLNKRDIFAYILLLLGFVTFFMRGMYFELEQFYFMAALSVLFIVYSFVFKKSFVPKSLLDYFVIAAVVVYLIACIQAVYIRSALMEVLRYFICYLTYILVKDLLAEKKIHFMAVSYLAGIMMTILTVGVAADSWFFSGYYNELEHILTSTFQYHNTSAVFLTCAFVFGVFLYAHFQKRAVRLAIAGGNGLLLLGIAFSQSRGTWLLLPLALAVFYLFLPKGTRKESLPVLLGSLLSLFVILQGFGSALTAGNGLLCWIWTIVGVLVSVLLTVLFSKIIGMIRINKKIITVILSIVLLVIVMVVIFANQLLPQTLLDRISGISLESKSVTERFAFYQDSYKVFKEYPITGTGGGGWPFVYRQYQSYHYLANNPHSLLLQFVVDTGILGLLLFLFLLVSVLVTCVRLLRHKVEPLYAPLVAALFMILAHGLFDFDFAYMTIMVFAWSLLALLAPQKDMSEKLAVVRWGHIVLAFTLAFVSICGAVAWKSYYSITKYNQSNPDKAYACSQRAVQFDPLNVMYRITYGDYRYNRALALKNEEQKTYELYKVKENLDFAYRINPRDQLLIDFISLFYASVGYPEQGIQMAETLPDLIPLSAKSYDRCILVYNTAAQAYQVRGDLAKVKETLQKIPAMCDRAMETSKQRWVRIDLSQETYMLIGQAVGILEEIKAYEETQ